jgi:hypothetical protein
MADNPHKDLPNNSAGGHSVPAIKASQQVLLPATKK